MSEKDKAGKKPSHVADDLIAQVAVEQARADTAEQEAENLKKKLETIEGERDSLRERVDSLESEIADERKARQPEEALREQVKALLRKNELLEKQRNDALSPERLRDEVKKRVALETAAGTVLGEKVRLDDLSDRQLMEQVVTKLHGSEIDSEKSDDYVRARFDAAIEGYRTGEEALDRFHEIQRKREEKEREKNGERKDAKSARQKFLDSQDNAWKGETDAR